MWAGHGFTHQDTAFIYLDEIDGSTLDNLGVFIAKLQLPGLETIGIYPLPAQNDILPGRTVLTDSVSGYRYIYGNKLNWIVWEPYVARILIGESPFTTYEYFTGLSWSNNPALAAKISADPVSPGFSVFKMASKCHLLTQENGYFTCGMGREIYTYVSDFPWGPFQDKTLVYTIEDKFDDNYLLTYNAQAHPSFTENGELLVSYNLNDWVDTLSPYICPSQCKDIWLDRLDADTYRPKFIRVPFVNGVDVEKIISPQTFILFPNPVKAGQQLTIEKTADATGFEIYAISGKLIHKFASEPGQKQFVAPQNPGIYFVKQIKAGEVVSVQKMVVISR